MNKEANIEDIEAGQRFKGQQGSSFPVLLPLPPGYCSKTKRARVDFQNFHRDMVAGSGDGVTGRGCFLLGKID
jgi:hypothetical protein